MTFVTTIVSYNHDIRCMTPLTNDATQWDV